MSFARQLVEKLKNDIQVLLRNQNRELQREVRELQRRLAIERQVIQDWQRTFGEIFENMLFISETSGLTPSSIYTPFYDLAKRVDPEQAAPMQAVRSGSTLFINVEYHRNCFSHLTMTTKFNVLCTI